MKNFGHNDAAAIKQGTVKASEIHQHVLSFLPPNFGMTARDNGCGCVDRSFKRRVPAKASQVLFEFNSLQTAGAGSGQLDEN
jgi:hypothetical protein